MTPKKRYVIIQNANRLQKQTDCSKRDYMAKSYSTISNTKIMKYMEENRDRLVTVSDVEKYLISENIEVNISTIYRFLNKLCNGGEVIKYVAKKGEMSSFQYVGQGADRCKNHIHLQCTGCGSVIHLECGFMEEIKSHIMEHHGFALQCESSVLYGLCKKCKEGA